MRVPRIPCLVAAFSVALGSYTAFGASAIGDSSNAVIEYTLTPEETVAYYGITAPLGASSNSGMNMFVWYYTDDTQTETQVISAARRVLDYTVLDLEGNEWIVIEYSYQTAAFIDRRNELQYTIWAQPALQFTDLYSITKGYGFQGADTRVQNPASNYVGFNWFLGDSGSTANQFQGYAAVPFPLKENGAYLTERWSRADTGGLFVCNSVTHTASSILPNIQLRKNIGDTVYYCAPNSTIIEDASGSSYSRMLVRCPTIRYAQSDEEAIKNSLQDILDSITQTSPEQDNAVSNNNDAVTSGTGAVDEYNDLEEQVITEISIYNPLDFYTFDSDSVTWFGGFWRFVEGMPFVMTFSSVGIMFAVLSYIMYGRK